MYVDDTFVVQQAKHSPHLLKHIHSRDPHISFTMEDPNKEGTLPFLDTLISLGPNNTLVTSVYQKPSHTEQYLHWDSNHFFLAKCSIYNTVAHRTRVVCTSESTPQQENEHIRQGLLKSNFPHGP